MGLSAMRHHSRTATEKACERTARYLTTVDGDRAIVRSGSTNAKRSHGRTGGARCRIAFIDKEVSLDLFEPVLPDRELLGLSAGMLNDGYELLLLDLSESRVQPKSAEIREKSGPVDRLGLDDRS